MTMLQLISQSKNGALALCFWYVYQAGYPKMSRSFQVCELECTQIPWKVIGQQIPGDFYFYFSPHSVAYPFYGL